MKDILNIMKQAKEMQSKMSELKDKILNSIENLVTLEIITAVGPVQMGPKPDSLEDDSRSYPDLDYDQNPKVILTKIDMLQGDIKTIYDEEFITGEYQSLKAFHAAREKEGHEIVRKNIENLNCKTVLAESSPPAAHPRAIGAPQQLICLPRWGSATSPM